MTLPKPVFITLVLTVIFWFYMFCLQAYAVWYAFNVGSPNPAVTSFGHRYAITTSIQLLAFVGIAAALSMAVYMLRSPWAAAALAVLSAVAVWCYFFAGLSLFFRPPFGDGSWSQALINYFEFHGRLRFRHLLQSITLFAILILWPICAIRLRHSQKRSD